MQEMEVLPNRRKSTIVVIAEIVVFLFLTITALANGRVTIFYIVYLYWWQELIHIIVSRIRFSPHSDNSQRPPVLIKLFMLGIYCIFIIVLFGVVGGIDSKEQLVQNALVFLFRNPYFDLSLLMAVGYELFWKQNQSQTDLSPFSSRMLVLHISIILGGILMFFVVRQHPQFFNTSNFLGNLLIISPFLLIKLFFRIRKLRKA